MPRACIPVPAAPPASRRRVTTALVAAIFALTAHASSGGAQSPPACDGAETGWCRARRFAGDVPGELGFRFGEPLDVDGDHVADLAAGARFTKRGIYQAGRAGVWSGATGKPLRTWDGPTEDSIFGHWTLAVPDLDGNGLADVVIAAPNATVDGDMRGLLSARSPKTGAEIWRRAGATSGQFGWDLALAGDTNADGRVDLFVGALGRDGGRVHLVSGRDGSVLRTYAPSVPSDSFGWYVARVDDLDGDGAPDLAVGAPPGYAGDDPPNGAAYLFGSRSGTELRRFSGTAPGAGFGEQVTALGDLDGDGRGELVVAAPGSNDQSRSLVGEVIVYSGATGAELRRHRGTTPGDLYGRMIVGAGDVDGDGREDLAIGAPWHRVGDADRVGRVELRSGRDGSLLAALEGDGAESWFGWHVRRAPDPGGGTRPALLIGALRQPVGGAPAVGVVDWLVLRSAPAVDQGINKRGGRRSDIK